MTDERDEETQTPAEHPAEPQDEHGLREDVRDAVAKAVGIAVEAGSMLAGESGELVSAEGTVAEADTERLIDRIEGEDDESEGD